MQRNALFRRAMAALFIWSCGVAVYAAFHNDSDKTPVFLAVLIGTFTCLLSVGLISGGIYQAVKRHADRGLPLVLTGLLLWPVAFLFYLLSAVIICF
jgi:hypothetical protein